MSEQREFRASTSTIVPDITTNAFWKYSARLWQLNAIFWNAVNRFEHVIQYFENEVQDLETKFEN
jgi:hypothetical protein